MIHSIHLHHKINPASTLVKSRDSVTLKGIVHPEKKIHPHVVTKPVWLSVFLLQNKKRSFVECLSVLFFWVWNIAVSYSVFLSVVWGECNHSFHNCCMSLWVKQNNRCPLCQQDWVVQRIGKWGFKLWTHISSVHFGTSLLRETRLIIRASPAIECVGKPVCTCVTVNVKPRMLAEIQVTLVSLTVLSPHTALTRTSQKSSGIRQIHLGVFGIMWL